MSSVLGRMQKLTPTELSHFPGFKPEVGQEEEQKQKQSKINRTATTHQIHTRTHARTHVHTHYAARKSDILTFG